MRSLWVSPLAMVQALVLVTDLNPVLGSNLERPNFVVMVVDDMGMGDLGCYGNKTLRTPNIDRLASEGAKLTQHIAASPLCSPSRAALLTGRLPIRTGVFGVIEAGVFIMTAGSGGLPPSEVTFASIAQKQGYDTALIGKWHLGLNCETSTDHCHHPNNHGFKYFFGFPLSNFRDCHPGEGSVFMFERFLPYKTVMVLLISTVLLYYVGILPIPKWLAIGVTLLAVPLAFTFPVFRLVAPYMNCILMRDGDILEQPFSNVNLTQRMTQEAVDFLERSAERPFLLFFSFLQLHTALFASASFRGSSRHGIYGDALHEVDWSVGQILQTLERLGLSENTVVYLTSDQGAHLEEISASGERHGGYNGIYKAGKGTNFEGGIRIPGLVRWPTKIRPGLEIHEPTSHMDMFPSVVQLSGGQLPQDREIDGRPLLDLLQGRTQSLEHEFMFHYCGSRLQAVRWKKNSGGVYKAFYFTPDFNPPNSSCCFRTHLCMCLPGHVIPHDPPVLYELSRDPSESTPLTPDSEPDFHSIVRTMELAVEEHRASLKPRDSEMTLGKILPKPWLQPCCSSITNLCQCSKDPGSDRV